jgi:glycine/betaine/sarcosine/D-proline reductase family selenoprotein B
MPTVHICAITPVAQMVGSNRILQAQKIVNPLGNANLSPQEEKKLRRSVVEKALRALQTETEEQRIFC